MKNTKCIIIHEWPSVKEKSVKEEIRSWLSIPETLVLEAWDIKTVIANARNTFKSYIDVRCFKDDVFQLVE